MWETFFVFKTRPLDPMKYMFATKTDQPLLRGRPLVVS